MMNKKIAILGCGWLSIPFAKYLINKGFKVKGSTTTKEKLDEFKASGLKPFLIDLYGREDKSDFLQADILIVAVPHKDIDNFKFLISQIESSNTKKVIYISSTSVYPNTNGVVTEETQVLDTPLSKIELLFSGATNFKTTIVRFAGLFGGRRKPDNFFKNGIKIRNQEGFVNMIHQDDCIRLLTEIILQDVWGEIFNACADMHPSRKDFYTKEMARVGRLTPLFEEDLPTSYKIVSNKKIKATLKYDFLYSDLMSYE